MKTIKIISLGGMLLASRMLYADSNLDLERELRYLQAEKNDVVEVVSKKSESIYSASGIVSLITHEEIERYNAKNLLELLSRMPSIYALGSGTFPDNTVSMRGDLYSHHSNHVLPLINGRPFRDSQTGAINNTLYRDFPIHQIERIEIIRGPGSALYGTNAYAGVINIVTKRNQETSATIRGGYGSFNSGRIETEVAWKNKEAAFTGAMRYAASDGWLFSANGEDGKPYSFRANDNDVSGSFWGEWQNITLNGYISSNEFNHWGPLLLGNGQIMNNNKIFLDLGYRKKFNEHWNSQWNLTYNQTGMGFNLNIPNNVSHLSNTANDFLFEQTHYFNFFDKQLNFLIGGLVEWQNGNTGGGYDYLKSSIYGEFNYAIFNNLKLTAGGQWNRVDPLFNASGNTAPVIMGKVGRLGLVYEMTDNIGFKLLYSQAFRNPSAGEMETNVPDILIGNNNLQPEKVTTMDAQVFYHTNDYSVSLTAFRSKQSHLIDRYPLLGSRTQQYQNEDYDIILKGLEFESAFKLNKQLQFTGAYTFQTNHAMNGQNNETPAPNHLAKIGLSYDVTPELQFAVFDTFFSAAKLKPGRAMVNPNTSGYHNLSVNSRYSLKQLLKIPAVKNITFSMYLDNLLDEKAYYPELANKQINSIPAMPGRSLFGEFAIEF